MTQKQLAERIGTRQSNIARLESGNCNPSFHFLQKVAVHLIKASLLRCVNGRTNILILSKSFAFLASFAVIVSSQRPLGTQRP
ncbi:MAG: helix-turn-helix transcriptional regulator [Treponema sp.]|uniref:helix-turn-helix transcriptional regulator n=1 Tax=Treponema sp. TaxID=166 RepID=UPI003FA2BC15